MSEKRARSNRGGGEDEGGRRSGRSKRQKEKLCDDSGQTAEERQILRAEQHKTKKAVIEQRNDIADPTKNNMVELTKQNNQHFQKVKFTREAVTDAETSRLIAEAASEQVKMVTQGSSGLDVDKFMVELVKIFSSASDDGSGATTFNWTRLGADVAQVYLSVPQGGGFMMGPLEKVAKGPRVQKKRVDRPTDDDAEEVVPETQAPKVGKSNKAVKDETQKRIVKMKSQCATSAKLGKKQDLFETLFNPKSFTQTVENIFDFSFFVKSRAGAITTDKDTQLPQVIFQDALTGEEQSSNPKQWLLSMNPAEFREIVELYEMEESNIRHRDEGKKSKYYDPLVHGIRQETND